MAMHDSIASRKISVHTLVLFLVPLILFILAAGGFKVLLIYLGLPIQKFLNGFVTTQMGPLSINWGNVFFGIGAKALCLLLVFLFLHWWERLYPHDFGLTGSFGFLGFKEAILINLKALIFFFFLLFLYQNFSDHFSSRINNFFYITPPIKKAVGFHFMNPAVEEIFFRGIYCTLFVRFGWHWRYAILTSGVLFGLTHLFNMQTHKFVVGQVIWATMLGCLFGWLFYKTRSLLLPMTWHYFINVLNLFGIAKYLII